MVLELHTLAVKGLGFTLLQQLQSVLVKTNLVSLKAQPDKLSN